MKNTGSGIFTIFIILLLLAAAGAGCTSSNNSPSSPAATPLQVSGNETIRIGAIYNIEGSEATFDVPSLLGAELAVNEINAAGGIDGKTLSLVIVNGKSSTSVVTVGAKELAASGTVPVIIGLSNPDHVLPAARAAAAEKVWFVTSGATSPKLPGQVPGYLYLACMGDNTQAAVGAEYAAGTLHAKNAYIIYESDKEYPTVLAGYFKERFLELNGTVEKEDTYLSTDTGYASLVANISALTPQPDILFVSGETWAEAEPVIRAIRTAGIMVPVMGGDGYDAPVLLTGGADGIDNVYFTTHTWFNPRTTNEKQKAFMNRYEQAYNTSAVPFAGLGYDTVMIVAEAIRNAGGNPSGFAEGMANITRFEGVTGNLTYANESHVPIKSVTLMKIENGTLAHIGEFTPAGVPAP